NGSASKRFDESGTCRLGAEEIDLLQTPKPKGSMLRLHAPFFFLRTSANCRPGQRFVTVTRCCGASMRCRFWLGGNRHYRLNGICRREIEYAVAVVARDYFFTSAHLGHYLRPEGHQTGGARAVTSFGHGNSPADTG